MRERHIRQIKCRMIVLMTAAAIFLLFRDEKQQAAEWKNAETISEADYAAIKAQRMEAAGENALPVRVFYEDTPLPYDAQTQSFMQFDWMRKKELFCETGQPEIQIGRLKTEDGERLLVYTADTYSEFSLWETPLPVLMLETKQEIGEAGYTEVEMTVFDQDSVIGETDRVKVGMHTRGASSQWIPKKSYRVKVEQENDLYGKKYPFLGMRPGREWVLYSFYGDESKMREKLSRDLWDDIVQESAYADAGGGLQMEYCELYLNGEYMGLYGMGTAVDRRNFFEGKSPDRQDLLFKTVNFDAPTLEDIAAAAGEESCKCLELKYASFKSADLWDTVGQYMHLAYYASDEEYLSRMQDYMEVDNHIDYWLFFLASGLDDNELKNIYLSISDAGNNTKILMTPWDMDMSWGVGYTGENIFMWGRNDRQYQKIMDFPIVSRMFSAGDEDFTERTKARWRQLRQEIITEERMLKRVDDYEALLWKSGVIEREQARWPQAPYASDIDYIRNYIGRRFTYLDEYMEQLGKGEWDDGWD